MVNVLAFLVKRKMSKKLREEAEVSAISEIMFEVRRVIIDTKVKANREREEFERKLREEEEAKAKAMRENEEEEDKQNLLVLKNLYLCAGENKDVREQNIKKCIKMLLEEARF